MNKKKITFDKIILSIVILVFVGLAIIMNVIRFIGFINKKTTIINNNVNIEKVIENKILDETGRSVEVEILEKEPLKVCTFYLDTCFKTETIDGAYEYKILIKDVEIPEVEINGTYRDAYSDKESYIDYYHYVNYINFYKQKQNIIKILDSTDNIKYRIYEDDLKIIHNVYIYTPDYELLKNPFKEINSLSKSNDYYHYYMYVTNDIDFYNSINFPEDKTQTKDIISGREKKLEFGLFRYDIIDEYEKENPNKKYYLVYGSQGCSGLCTRVYEKD